MNSSPLQNDAGLLAGEWRQALADLQAFDDLFQACNTGGIKLACDRFCDATKLLIDHCEGISRVDLAQPIADGKEELLGYLRTRVA